MVIVAIGAALVTALLLWAASPAVGVGWLAWVALVPVAMVALGAPGSRAGRLAVPLAYVAFLELLLVPSLPFGLADGQWGEAPAPVLIGGSPVLAVALVAIPLFGLALYGIRFGLPWGAGLAGARLFPVLAVLVPAFAWTALDLARVKLDPGGSWGPLFLSQLDTPASGLATLGGPWLVTLAIVGLNYGFALALLHRRPAPALVPAAAIAAALLVPAGAGAPQAGTRITVAAVQPGYDTAEKERPELRHWRRGSFNLAAHDLITDLGELTDRAGRAGADLVVWPEAVTFVNLGERASARGALARVARRSGTTILAPYFDHAARTSEALAVAPDGRITSSRPKQRPMWFLGERRAEATEPGPLDAAGVRLGALLGVDVQDPSLARGLVAGDAELLASSTHDWSQLATQHRALGALAAGAAGAPLVRADWRYGSAIYDRDAAALADAGEERRRAVITAQVKPGQPTIYARIGDFVGWISLGIAAAAWLAGWRARAATREGGPAFGGRGPRRGSARRRPSPARPHAGGDPSRPPA